MQNNDDLINNILNELDEKKKGSAPPSGTEDATTEFTPVDDGSEKSGEKNAPEKGDYVNYYEDAPKKASPKSKNKKAPKNAPPENNAYAPDPRAAAFAPYPDAQSPDNHMMPQQPPHRKKKKKKKKRSRVPGVLILTTFIFAVSIILSMVIIGFGKDMLGIGKSEETKLIVIPQGSGTQEIAELLRDEGIIKSPKFFVLFSRLRKADSLYIPGEHFVRPNMAYETIIQNLTTDEEQNKETVEVTFPEGITLLDAADILQKEGVCSKEDFLFYFNAGGYGFSFEDMVPMESSLKFQRMEGYVFPDTYYFYKEMEPKNVCQRIYLNFNQKMTKERLQKMQELDLSLDQLITFSSMVQAEASNVDDMKKIASVFWNRLRNKDEFPKLESDPTKDYANTVIKPNMAVYDKTIVDAYNTYEGSGLPPGAICNPGLDAIDAVLENYRSNYFFFVANIYTGETFFSETLEEHIEKDNARLEAQAKYEEASREAAAAAAAAAAEQEANNGNS